MRRQRASGRRRSAPSPVHGASTSTRSKVPARYGGSVPSAVTTPTTPGRALVGLSVRCTSPARAGLPLVGDQPRAPLGGERRQQRGLAAGPAHRSSQSSSRPSSGASATPRCDQLRPLVLDAGPPLGDRRHRPRVATLEHHAVRRVGGRLPRQLVAGGAAGPRHQGHPGILVVGGEQLLQLGLAHGPAELVDDPLRVAEGERGVPGRRRAGVGGDLVDPLVEVVLAHRAEHRVGEVPRARDPGPRCTRSTVVLMAAWTGTRIDTS